MDLIRPFRNLLGTPVSPGDGNNPLPHRATRKEVEQHFRHMMEEQRKGVNFTLGPNIQFFSGDGTRTIYRLFGGYASSESERVTRDTAYAAAAYLNVAVRYRMRKIAEAPLMVVEEDKETGDRKWLSDYPLSAILDTPSPDFDMGQLLARTIAYKDITGAAIWKKDLTGGGMIGRLTPFYQGEFTVEQADDRIYGKFTINTATGSRFYTADDVVLFQEINPFDWHNGQSKVDVVLSWLNLGQQARASVQDILQNSLFPSVIVQPHHEWNPDKDEFDLFKQQLEEHSTRDKRGGPLTLLGGGTATRTSLTLRDMIPGDILDRVESVVSAVFGIPAVVLQYQIGMENAPWSQMEEARRMAYEDSIEPEWRELERVLDRQLLWAPTSSGSKPLESNRMLHIAFDTSRVRALQKDLVSMTAVAVQQSTMSSLNERRMLVGLEPEPDPLADEIPELAASQAAANAAAASGQGGGVQATALNGAQIASLVEVVSSVAEGRLPRSSATAIILAAFPLLGEEVVARIMADVEEGSNAPAPEPEVNPFPLPAIDGGEGEEGDETEASRRHHFTTKRNGANGGAPHLNPFPRIRRL